MSNRKGKDKFIDDACHVHGYKKYDYSLVDYKNNKTKVIIICPIHGAFMQTPDSHLRGHGCPKCHYEKAGSYHKYTNESIVDEFKKVHGDKKYNYEKVDYSNFKDKVCIICPVHGEFWQSPANHIKGCGCPKCKCMKISDSKTKYVVGKVFTHPIYGKYKIIERVGDGNVKLEFLSTGYVTTCSISSISTNSFKDYKFQSVYKIGCKGYNKWILKNIDDDIAYNIWHSMMERCYAGLNDKFPSYIDCTVCDEWHDFSNFKDWFEANYIEGYELDKDILIKGNKVYSPDTCCFVPKTINAFFSSISHSKGDYPLGVSFDKSRNKFIAQITVDGKHIHIGRFNTIEDAFNAYKKEKENALFHLANKYKDFIDDKVHNAILNRRIEITD